MTTTWALGQPGETPAMSGTLDDAARQATHLHPALRNDFCVYQLSDDHNVHTIGTAADLLNMLSIYIDPATNTPHWRIQTPDTTTLTPEPDTISNT